MPTTKTQTREESEVRARMDAVGQALRAKEIDTLMTYYAPDMVVFDLRPPLQGVGANAYRKNFEAWFDSVQGPIDYELRDLQITVRDDLALCHYLAHVKTTRKAGEKLDY